MNRQIWLIISLIILTAVISCDGTKETPALETDVLIDKWRQERVGLRQLIWLDVSAKASGYTEILDRVEIAKRRIAADEKGESFTITAIASAGSDSSRPIIVYLYCARDDVASVHFLDTKHASLGGGVLPSKALPEHGAIVPCHSIAINIRSISGVPRSGFVNLNEVEINGPADQVAFVDIRFVNGESAGIVDVVPQAKFLSKKKPE